MQIHPIRHESDYRAALKEVSGYFDADPEPMPESPEGKRFLALLKAIDAYEKKKWPIDPPSASEAAEFRRDQMHKTAP